MSSKSLDDLTDDEILKVLYQKETKMYRLEEQLSDAERCVRIRREYIRNYLGISVDENLSYKTFDYQKIARRNCENVIGFVSLPVGLAGPIRINDAEYWIPLATTEGCLVASTSRGARCVDECGVNGYLIDDAMTRAPVLKVDTLYTAYKIKKWLGYRENFNKVKDVFESTSGYLKLISIKPIISGRFVFLRYRANSGEAMGMNMLSKGADVSVNVILQEFSGQAQLLSVSGNLCADKKSSAINWIEGRGKSVVCEALIPSRTIESKLHISAEKLVELNTCKNLVGSSTACTIGGNNANAANVVAAIFAATGQDIAQVVESSQCLTFLEMQDKFLYISCTMPSIEVGTVGGGTHLSSQRACLNMMKLDRDESMNSSSNLAIVICSAVLCSELSLLAALSTDTLVDSHMKFNRSPTAIVTCKTV